MSRPKGVTWARVSTAEQVLGYSLEAQAKLPRKAAADRMIDVVHEFQIQETGSRSAARKHFRAMVEFVKAESIDYILVFKIDRLARNYKDFYALQELIEKGVNFFIVNENKIISAKSTSQERFSFRILGDIAQLEGEQIGERAAFGMAAKMHTGEIVWEAPVGYLNAASPADPEGRRRTVVIDPERSVLVKQAFELYATGKFSISTLTDELTRRGLAVRPGARRAATALSRHCVNRLLKNRFYIGEFYDRRAAEWRQHPYELFIDTALFATVQARLSRAVQGSKGRRDKERFWFKPFLRCFCGAQITAYEPKPGRVYYDCSQSHVKRNGKKKCPSSVIYPAERIDAMLTEAIGKLYVDDKIAARIKASLCVSHDVDDAECRRELRRLQTEQRRLTRHLDLIYTDRLDERITPDEYSAHRVRTSDALADVTRRMDGLTERNVDYQEQGSMILELLKGFRETYIGQDHEGKARILAVVLARVTLRGDESDFVWHPPFDVLFSIGELVLKGEGWRA